IDMKRIDNGYIIITKSLTSISKEISSLKNVNYEKPNINKDEILKEIEELKSKLVDVDMNELNQQKKLIDNYKYLQSKLSVTEDNLNNILDIQPPTIDIQSAKKYLSNNEKLKEISNALTNIKSKLEAINIYKDEVAPMYKELLNFTPSLWKATYSDNDLKQISDIKHTITLYMTTEEHTDSMDEFNQLISFIKSKWDIDSDSILKAKTMYRHVVEKLKIDVRLNDIMKEINSYHPTPDTLYDIIDDLIKEYTTEYNNKLELYNELNKEPHISSDEFTKISDDWAKYNNYISTKQQYEKDLVTLKAQIYDISQKIKYSEDELSHLMRSAENNKMIMDNISNKENVIRLYELWEKEEASRQQKLVTLCNKEEYLSKLKTYFKQLPIVIRHVLFEPIQEIINNDFFDIFSFSNLGKITIDWDKVELRIGDLTYDQLSGAQRCTLALTLRLALLKRLGMHMPLMLIDEPTNHLDSKRISDLVKYFTLLHRQTQMFVATHNVDIIPDLDTIVIDTTN
ncbi:MAG TPA: AAA family ATPase, partial [Candidatus Diapherotrites archaeon]|nr:AAA family ATPase [Candidatus Diapherotrites archaeon]